MRSSEAAGILTVSGGLTLHTSAPAIALTCSTLLNPSVPRQPSLPAMKIQNHQRCSSNATVCLASCRLGGCTLTATTARFARCGLEIAAILAFTAGLLPATTFL
jgi:hypothetical protein